jgi:hypothetical protein
VRTWRRTYPYLLLLTILWLNAYIARDFFRVESTAHMNSMHGVWAALARWGGAAWWRPTWWPFWDGGMPFEYTYAPLMPAWTSLIAKHTGVTELRALQAIMGFVYVLGPGALYFSLWRLTHSAGASFAAAAAYSLLSPSQLLAPDERFAFSKLWNSERLYLIAVWDEMPHMAALALAPLAVLCLFRIVETRRASWIAGGALIMSAMVYASAFGATLIIVSATCLLAATGFSRAAAALIGITGVFTYLASCVALPPSLITLIREAADSHGHGWTAGSWTALAVVGVVWTILLPLLYRRVTDQYLRFFILFTVTSCLVVWMYVFAGRQFVPQPARYKLELSLGLAVTTAFALRLPWSRLRLSLRLALTALLIALAGEQVIAQRRWAKEVIREKDITRTIEYRAAKWIDEHISNDARVMLPGSMAQWLNAFSQRVQWTGSSWATAPNRAQQSATDIVYAERGTIEASMAWFHAFGVQAVAVSGANSPEFWKPFADKTKYDGKLEEMWSEEDTKLYRVPLRSASLAHALPEEARTTGDWEDLKRFAAALDTERLPGLDFTWQGRNHALIRGEVQTGEAVSVQVTHHPGWRAVVNGVSTPIARDGIGLMWIRPECRGECTIELAYSGGTELILCRAISALTLIGLWLFLMWSWRTNVTLFQRV